MWTEKQKQNKQQWIKSTKHQSTQIYGNSTHV